MLLQNESGLTPPPPPQSQAGHKTTGPRVGTQSPGFASELLSVSHAAHGDPFSSPAGCPGVPPWEWVCSRKCDSWQYLCEPRGPEPGNRSSPPWGSLGSGSPVSKLPFITGFLIDFRETGMEIEREKKKTSVCCSTYWCIHTLIFVCALTGDWTHNLGVSGGRSDKLRYPARAKLEMSNLVEKWVKARKSTSLKKKSTG